MPKQQNPYYNPLWQGAAEKFKEALVGNPEKAGAIAYNKARTRLSGSKADRQDIENAALTGGLQSAIDAGGNDPTVMADNMGALMQAFAAGGVTNPGNYTAPIFAIKGHSQSGADPAEALVRAAYTSKGAAIPTDLALTPARQDEIRRSDQVAALTKALEVQKLKNLAPRKTTKSSQPKIKDIDAIVSSVMGSIPGATYRDQYQREQIEPDVMDYLSTTGVFEAIREAASGNFAAGPEDARQTIVNALDLPAGSRFDPEGEVLEEGSYNPLRMLPGGKPFFTQRGPAFVGADNAPIDIGAIISRLQADRLQPLDRETALAEIARRQAAGGQ